MTSMDLFGLAAGGLLSGILAGFLGIGGGTILVPILVALGYIPVQAVATSSWAIVITSLSGSWQNWRMGYLDLSRVMFLGIPALITAQLGVLVAGALPGTILLIAFGIFLMVNVFLVEVRKQIVLRAKRLEGLEEGDRPLPETEKATWSPVTSRIVTGGLAGFMAGIFGIGGGVIMVPLQILLLKEPIKLAIQTSLGVIVMTALSSTAGHAIQGNVLWLPGLILGLGGLLGVQVSTRILPKLPEQVVSLLFRSMLFVLALYIFWQAANPQT
ncbi:MAG: sulfite exporter TauE/SafE family protein [Synechococcales cyanobacterium K44_A2020_017]|nr:sulfite exporter TauE/SafE family protein [Synechococcales cyanobacterium K32_A2020_035]MBF2093758.1 sulfite exporter TauE/SafE family protein [Synechococcales cyanobacterium K44_A2020_017]